MDYAHEKLKEIFESTVEDDNNRYDGKIETIDYYSLFCKAAANNKLFKLMGNNLVCFNCVYEGDESVLIVFYIPINSEESSSKNVSEKIIEIIDKVEKCFTTIDYVTSQEVKEEKFIYLTIIKKIEIKKE
jgi:hypothetical protein